ncbi:LysE family translocator [Psychrobacter pygoscelis]|uniref:LysE family translocator n=1 Tax=Psychrobacter pygoscelis TaxID=2488563 RepID=UPI00103E8FB4|nr:LysE family translocator [Psychrobacter pygoscelis]
MSEILAVATITILAVISPGGDFAIVTRNSYLHGQRCGLFTAIGIAAAVWIHVAYTLLGVSVILQQSAFLLNIVKLIGTAYLVTIGIQTYRHTESQNIQLDSHQASTSSGHLSAATAFKNGFMTNALNPKTTLFVLSIYSQVVSIDTSLIIQVAYGLFMSLAHLLWFTLVACILSHSRIREQLLQKQVLVNRIIGIVLGALGILLLLSSL